MGTAKKEKNRRAREGSDMANVKVKGENFYRDAAKVKKVNMYKDGKPVRNSKGDIVKAAAFQSKEIPKARVEPNRRWFGNTRVIAQDALAEFRERIGAKMGTAL
jgi:nuclear GTP-binding protein